MPAIAKWLAARPFNAVMGLLISVLLPAPQIVSGGVLVMLVLKNGQQQALLQSAIAAAVLLLISMLLGGTLLQMQVLIAEAWIAAFLLATLLLKTRSLTLVMQVAVIAALLGLLLFVVAVEDPLAFWQPRLDLMSEIMPQLGLQFNTELLTAEMMTVSTALGYWMMYTAALLLGYALYRSLPDVGPVYGQFSELNFGRVIAVTLAIASILVTFVDIAWLRSVAIVLFVIFIVQGLAIVHWLKGRGSLPSAALVAVYVLLVLPVLQIIPLVVLAFLGYLDAWFGIRRRLEKA